MLTLIKTTIIGGIVFLLPIAIFVAVIGKAWRSRLRSRGHWQVPCLSM
jgi:hypothetical protein